MDRRLGFPRASRAVHQQRHVFARRAQVKQIFGARIDGRQGGVIVRLDHPNLALHLAKDLLKQFGVLRRDEYDFCVAVIQHVRQLDRARTNIERNCDAAAIHCSKKNLRGVESVVHQERGLVSGLQSH